MVASAAHLGRMLPGLWAGVLLCIALLATPAPFATLAVPEAGRVVAHIFLREAYLSLAVAVLLLLLERQAVAEALARGAAGTSRMSTQMLLLLGTLFCTVAGYFGVQPMLAAAKAGQATALSFGQLHAISLGLFGLKIVLVLALAWRGARRVAAA